MGLYYDQEEHVWKRTGASEGIYEDVGRWYYCTIYYGSIERFGPFSSEDKAKIDYLEHLLWSACEQISWLSDAE